jgi:3-deoxy-D-manno-octulosonic-acid transferase
MWLAQPLLKRKLTRRGIAEPGYLQAIDERFGRYAESKLPSGTGFVWVHAVSLGEARAAAPLIAGLRQQLPGMRLLLTHGTATGRAEGQSLLRVGDVQVWQPWDTPATVRRFLARFKPCIGVLIETELWPNLVAACVQTQMPLVLANARLSEQSLQKAQRLAWLADPAYRALTAVWAQTEADAVRLRQLGAPVKGVFGNVKFDAEPRPDQLGLGRQWHQAWMGATARPVLMFASSREGEELLLLQALQRNRPPAPVNSAQAAIETVASSRLRQNVQWLIVPRHPQRFDEVAGLLTRHGFAVSRRSAWPNAAPTDAEANTVWLGDSLGEMALYYGLADAVLLGGSFEPLGGQNLIEAAACGCPVVMGPHTFNFLEAAELALSAGAALRVDSMDQAVQAAVALVSDPAKQAEMSQAANRFALAHRGAVAKTVAAVAGLLR